MASLLGSVVGGALKTTGTGLGNQIREEAKAAREAAIRKEERDFQVAESEKQRAWQEKQTHNQNVNNWLTNYARDERLNKQKIDQIKLADEIEDGNRKNYKPSLWMDQFGTQNTEGVGIAIRQKDQYGEEAEISGALDLWKAKFGSSNGSGKGGSAKGWFSTTQKVYSGENDPLGQPVVVGERTIMYNRDLGIMRVIEPNGKMSERILSPEQADELTSRLGERAAQVQQGVDEQAARAAVRHQANPEKFETEYAEFAAANGYQQPQQGVATQPSAPAPKQREQSTTIAEDIASAWQGSDVKKGMDRRSAFKELGLGGDGRLLYGSGPSADKVRQVLAKYPQLANDQQFLAAVGGGQRGLIASAIQQ